MRKNVGSLDAFLRLTMGFFGLAWGISKMTRRSGGIFPLIITLAGAMKIAEGVMRYCPVMDWFGVNTLDKAAGKEYQHQSSDESTALQKTERPAPHMKEERGSVS